jgi:hypothetical protein
MAPVLSATSVGERFNLDWDINLTLFSALD